MRHRLQWKSKRKKSQSAGDENRREYTGSNLPLTAISAESLQELEKTIENTSPMILQSTPLPLDPDLSGNEDAWIRYLMDDVGYDGKRLYTKPKNDYYSNIQNKETFDDDQVCAIVQCRVEYKIDEYSETVPVTSLYQEFDRAVKVLGSRRDVLFSLLDLDGRRIHNEAKGKNNNSFCTSPEDDGLVALISRPFSDEGQYKISVLSNTSSIVDGLSLWLRPTVLWFDRRFAPIAFHPRYRRHAVLFTDFHNEESAGNMRDAIRLFKNECRKRQRNDVENSSDNFIFCLVVPSTEIRAMKTFGVDIWSDMDRMADEKIQSIACSLRSAERANCVYTYDDPINRTNFDGPLSILPMLLVTDRDDDGITKRYYLDSPITKISISGFFDDLLRGDLKPEIKSSPIDDYPHGSTPRIVHSDRHNIKINSHGVNLLSGYNLRTFLKINKERHTLLQLFAPTCGHCKRFNIIWNALGDLIEFLGWSNILVVARIDVTLNEVLVPGMVTSTWLPDIFYFGVGAEENPIQFINTTFANDQELGAMSDPLELIDWWIDISGLSTNELRRLHNDL